MSDLLTRTPDWHYRRSLASRVTLLATVAVAVTVAGVALSAYLTARVQLQESLDESLLTRATAAAGTGALSSLTSQQVPAWALGAADVRIAFIAPGQPVRTADRGPSLQLGDPEVDVAAGRSAQSVRTVVGADGVRYRVVAVPVEDGVGALVLAQSLEATDRTLEKLGLVMLLFGAIGAFGAATTGWAVARNGLRPVRRLTAAAEEIARTEDLTPIEVEGNDEIARLASAFNAMLAALASSRDRQRQLVADASHELRTPLTSLRTNLDLLRQSDRGTADGTGPVLTPQARGELLDDVSAQIEEMTTLIGDLVELAREEPLQHAVELVDLAEVVERAVARVRRRAPGIELDVEVSPWHLDGEPGSLERAVTNLLDNAAKWSPPLGTVTVRLAPVATGSGGTGPAGTAAGAAGGTATAAVVGELLVEDEGPGIADEDLPHVFDRFYRSRESRALPGSGLGLSIVRQVVERHGGTAEAGRAARGGARFTVRLPGRDLGTDRVG